MPFKFCFAVTVLMLLAGVACVNGQAYFKLGVAYGFPLAGQQIGSKSHQGLTTSIDPETGFEVPRILIENENINGSYGAGPAFSGAFGYMFTDNLGVEGAISYFSGREYEMRSTYLDSRLNNILYDATATVLARSKGFLFSPMLKLSLRDGLVRPYLMAGPVLGKVDFVRDYHSMSIDEGVASSESRSTHYSGGIASGARGVAGVEIAIKPFFSLFGEAVVTGMSYHPKTGEIRRYEVNGNDRLGTLTTGQRVINYVKRVTFDTDNPGSIQDGPDQQTRVSIPLSSIAANIGVKVNFGY